ncbi:uncharacterized protein LOC109834572 [Asparagus officinalis]|uniref:uncharacterized protein LOC109834572 n=1 Tax=Asparagus officinalis TaxID=4686 RepID=UPI00098E3C74|nr:uncharacterized protein LOC109834572 [Asparagus officinalis]
MVGHNTEQCRRNRTKKVWVPINKQDGKRSQTNSEHPDIVNDSSMQNETRGEKSKSDSATPVAKHAQTNETGGEKSSANAQTDTQTLRGRNISANLVNEISNQGMKDIGSYSGNTTKHAQHGGTRNQVFRFSSPQVFPEIYGDNDTHLMAYWTRDGFQSTGCYNLLCKGFVPYKPSAYVLGTKIRPLSTYDGDQYDITLRIFKDTTTGDWVLHAGRQGDKRVGHWPKSLFTNLAEAATHVQFGGFVSYHPGDRTPPMGSGHSPDDGGGKAAYLKNLFVISPTGEFSDPSPVILENHQDCYHVGGNYLSSYPVYISGPGGCTFT